MQKKTLAKAGPFCGDEQPRSYLSQSHKIKIIVEAGVIPDGLWYRGYMFTYKDIVETKNIKNGNSKY